MRGRGLCTGTAPHGSASLRIFHLGLRWARAPLWKTGLSAGVPKLWQENQVLVLPSTQTHFVSMALKGNPHGPARQLRLHPQNAKQRTDKLPANLVSGTGQHLLIGP